MKEKHAGHEVYNYASFLREILNLASALLLFYMRIIKEMQGLITLTQFQIIMTVLHIRFPGEVYFLLA